MRDPAASAEVWQMAASGLSELHSALKAAGYRVIGPRASGSAIVLGELNSARELPFGWGVTLAPGGYRLRQRDDDAAFGHSEQGQRQRAR